MGWRRLRKMGVVLDRRMIGGLYVFLCVDKLFFRLIEG